MSESEWKTGYKVCCQDFLDGSYHSVCVFGSGMVTYAIGAITVPNRNCGPLAVFDSFIHAKEFVESVFDELEANDHVFIFECAYLPDTTKHPGYQLWHFLPLTNTTIGSGSLPPGTVLAQKVQLIEQLPVVFSNTADYVERDKDDDEDDENWDDEW